LIKVEIAELPTRPFEYESAEEGARKNGVKAGSGRRAEDVAGERDAGNSSSVFRSRLIARRDLLTAGIAGSGIYLLYSRYLFRGHTTIGVRALASQRRGIEVAAERIFYEVVFYAVLRSTRGERGFAHCFSLGIGY